MLEGDQKILSLLHRIPDRILMIHGNKPVGYFITFMDIEKDICLIVS